jgi:general stress protein YciG
MVHENLNTPPQGGTGRTEEEAATSSTKKSNRGFASMDRSKQREIASKGGRAAHEKGTAHQFTPDEARNAGRKGGGTVSQDRQHMAEIGRIGGQARGRRQRTAAKDKEGEAQASPLSSSSPPPPSTSETSSGSSDDDDQANEDTRH